MKINRAASWMIIITIILLALYYGKSIILPFIIAALIWFVVKKMRNMLDKIGFIRRYIPRWIKTIFATFFIFGLLIITAHMLTVNIEQIVASYESYSPNIEFISKQISATLNINLEEQIRSFFNWKNISPHFQSVFSSLSELLGNMILVLFYVLFLFLEENLFQKKVLLLFQDQKQQLKFNEAIFKIDKMLGSYISLKSLVSFTTAFLSFIVFLFIGIDSPFFWAALIFLFNFIPSIGSILATMLPALFSLIQFGEFWPFLIILFVVGGIQVLVGNYLEPRLMGNTLNISPLVTIFSLALGGSIWGITGMLLSVPITVALIIILSQFASTRPIAIMLSEKGRL